MKQPLLQMTTLIEKYIKNIKIRQFFSLFGAMVINVPLGIAISILLTNNMSVKNYGDYQFVFNFYNFIIPFFYIGIFTSVSRLVALDSNKNVLKNYIGFNISYSLFVFIVYSILIIVFLLFFYEKMYPKDIKWIMYIILPFSISIVFKNSIETLLIGLNDIYKFSILQVFPKIIFVTGIYILLLSSKLTTQNVLTFRFVCILLIIFFIIIKLKPNFNFKEYPVKQVIRENKNLGFQVYLSFLANTGTNRISFILISYYLGNESLAIFSLAKVITKPLSFIPTVLGNIFFKNFTNAGYIKNKIIYLITIISIVSFTLFVIFINKVFFLVYPTSYELSLQYSYYFAFASIARGYGDFFNRFLVANGLGNIVRNNSIYVGIINLLGFSILIKYFSITGAAVTMIIANMFYLTRNIYLYKKIPSVKKYYSIG